MLFSQALDQVRELEPLQLDIEPLVFNGGADINIQDARAKCMSAQPVWKKCKKVVFRLVCLLIGSLNMLKREMVFHRLPTFKVEEELVQAAMQLKSQRRKTLKLGNQQ